MPRQYFAEWHQLLCNRWGSQAEEAQTHDAPTSQLPMPANKRRLDGTGWLAP